MIENQPETNLQHSKNECRIIDTNGSENNSIYENKKKIKSLLENGFQDILQKRYIYSISNLEEAYSLAQTEPSLLPEVTSKFILALYLSNPHDASLLKDFNKKLKKKSNGKIIFASAVESLLECFESYFPQLKYVITPNFLNEIDLFPVMITKIESNPNISLNTISFYLEIFKISPKTGTTQSKKDFIQSVFNAISKPILTIFENIQSISTSNLSSNSCTNVSSENSNLNYISKIV